MYVETEGEMKDIHATDKSATTLCLI